MVGMSTVAVQSQYWGSLAARTWRREFTGWRARTQIAAAFASAFALFLVLAGIGIGLTREAGNVAVFWPANAAMACLALANRPKFLPAIIIGAAAANFLANTLFGDPAFLSAGLSFANLTEIALMTLALRSAGLGPGSLSELSGALISVAILAAAPVPASIVGATVLHLAFGSSFELPALRWWMADTVSAMIVLLPFLAASRAQVVTRWHHVLSSTTALEVLLLISMTGVEISIVKEFSLPLFIAMLAPMLWISLRLGVFWTSLAGSAFAVVTSLLTIAGVLASADPLGSMADHVFKLQVMLILSALPLLLTAVAITARDSAIGDLAQSEKRALEKATLLEIALATTKTLVARLEGQEAQLRRNEQVFQHVSKMAGIGGWEADIASGTLHWTPQVYKIYELQPNTNVDLAKAIGFFPDEARPTVEKLVNQAVATGLPYEFELPFVTAKGRKRLVRALAETEMVHGRTVRLFGTFQDVTEQRAAESRTLQSQKMDALGQLTGGIAHDFNNILAGVIGNLQIYLKTAAGAGAEGKPIAAALTAARRGAKITSRLLAFSRGRDPFLEPVKPSALISGIAEMLRDACGLGIRLSVSIHGDPWLILSDASQLEMALVNLVINARDASNPGDHIEIEVENLDATRSELTPPVDGECGDCVRISVVDVGIGIPPSIIGKVRDPFFTTKDVGMGTGLGLCMVHGFVTRSGGSMTIESEEGAGTRVSLLLPRLRPEPEIVTP